MTRRREKRRFKPAKIELKRWWEILGYREKKNKKRKLGKRMTRLERRARKRSRLQRKLLPKKIC